MSHSHTKTNNLLYKLNISLLHYVQFFLLKHGFGPSRSFPTRLPVLFSRHRALQDIHIDHSWGEKGRFLRSEDGAGFSDWVEDRTEIGSLHISPGYPNKYALVRFWLSDSVISRLIWTRINFPPHYSRRGCARPHSHSLYAWSALNITDPGAWAPVLQ